MNKIALREKAGLTPRIWERKFDSSATGNATPPTIALSSLIWGVGTSPSLVTVRVDVADVGSPSAPTNWPDSMVASTTEVFHCMRSA